MNSTPESEDTSKCEVLLVYHLEDEPIVRCIDSCLLELSAAQLTRDLIFVGVSNDSVDDLEAVVISAGQKRQGKLWSLLGLVSDASKFDVFTIATEELDEEDQLGLAGQSRTISARCEELRASRIVESRVFIPEYGRALGLAPSLGFFTSRTANLIVLPVDQQSPQHMAIPVKAADPAFVWHVAMEIVSLTCSWSGTIGEGVGFEPIMRGVADDPVVEFVRSGSTAIIFDELRYDGMVDELPVPEGLSPAPVPRRVLDSVDVLYPADFRIESPDEPEFAESGQAKNPRKWIMALRTLPKTVWLGLDRVKANLREELVDDIVGENPWMGRIFNPSDFDDTERFEVGSGLDPAEPVTALPGFDHKTWSQLVQDVLGMADGGGGEQAAAGRRCTGSESFVVMNRKYLTNDDIFHEVLSKDQFIRTDDDDESEQDRAVSTKSENLEESEESVTEDSTEQPKEPELEVSEDFIAELAPTLLGAMIRRFQAEADRCRMRLSKFKDEFENLTRSIREADQAPIPGPVGLAPLAAVWLAIVSLALFSPLYESLDISDWLEPEGRLRAFVLSTAATVAFLLLPIKPSNPKRTQSFVVLSCALGSLITASLLMFPPTGDFWMGIGVVVGLVILGILVWNSGQAKRRPRQRATGLLFLMIYVTLNLIVVLNLELTPFQDRIAEYRGRVFFITIVVAIVTFIASTIVLTLVMNRILHLQGGWRRRADFLRDNARWEGDQLPILEAIRTNWLGTAVALDYIVCNPYGLTEQGSASGGSLVQPEILRLRTLNRQPPQKAPNPGWLGAKYRLVAEEYRQKYGSEAPPEQSRQVSMLSETILGSDTGGDPRWDFARRLRQGEFNRLLSDPITVEVPVPNEADAEAMSEVAPAGPVSLPVGFLGDSAARVGNVDMRTIWWWPEDVEAPSEAAIEPRPSTTVRAGGVTIYQTVRVDVSDPVLFSDLDPGAHPPDDWDGLRESADGDLLF